MEMEKDKIIDAEGISKAAEEIQRLENKITLLRKEFEAAKNLLNGAECELSNARIKFTRAVDGYLSIDDLKQKSTRISNSV